MTDELLNTAEVAEYLGLSSTHLRKWRMTGDGPRFVKLGGAIRYRRSAVEEFVSSRERLTTNQPKEPS